MRGSARWSLTMARCSSRWSGVAGVVGLAGRDVGGEPAVTAGLHGMRGDPALRADLVRGLAGVSAQGRGLAAQDARQGLPPVVVPGIAPDEQLAGRGDQALL